MVILMIDFYRWVCGYCRKSDITRYCINRHVAKVHEGKPELVTVLTPNDEIESWVKYFCFYYCLYIICIYLVTEFSLVDCIS